MLQSKEAVDSSKNEDKSLVELSGAERFNRAQQRIKEVNLPLIVIFTAIVTIVLIGIRWIEGT